MVLRLSVPVWLLVGAFCWAFVPSPVQAQSDATLRVVVTSAEDGGPLQGTNVLLMNPETGNIVEAGATNQYGYHEMRGLGRGRYIIQISYVGFETHRDTLELDAGQRLYSVAMAVKPGQLEGVTVEGTRGAAEREAGLQTIRPSGIDRIPAPGPTGDLASYLQTLPGVMSVGDRGGQLYIRGGAPSQNRYLVDGLPIVRPFHISSFYSAFPENIIQSVDLYAGGFGAEYGGATSSILDVRLRPGNLKEYTGSAAVGPHLASINVEGPIVRGEQSFLFSSRYSLIEEVGGPLFGQDAPIDFYDVMGRYSFQQESASCNVTTMFTHDQGSIDSNLRRRFSWSNTLIGGRCFVFEEQFDHTFSVRAGYSGFENSVGTVGSPEQTASRWRLYLILNHDQTFLGHPIDFGARVTAGRYSATINEQFVGVKQFSRGQGKVRLHWSLDWTLNDHLTLTPSVAALTTTTLRPKIDPRLRVSIRPGGTDTQEINLAAGLYHQTDGGISDQRDAGNVFTVWRPPDAEDPLPRALHAIVGYRHHFGSFLEVSVEGYARRLENTLVAKWTSEVGTNTETALADGTAYGADARVVVTQGPFYAYLGYGWSKVTYEATTDDLGAWAGGDIFSYAPPHDRRHQVNAVSSYEFKGVTASVSWELGTGRPFTKLYGFNLGLDVPEERPTEDPGTSQTLFQRPYGSRLPPYHRLDVSLERSFSLSNRLGLDAKVGAINVYDRRNVFYYDADTLQRINQSPLLPYFSLKLRVE